MKKHDEMLASLATLATSVAPTAAAHVRLRPIDVARRGHPRRAARGPAAGEPRGDDSSRRGGARARRDARQPPDRSGTGLGRRGAAWSSATPTSTSGSRRSPGSSGASRRAELERLARETIELVAAAQEPDGYLNTLVPGPRSGLAVDRPRDGPRALLRGSPDPGRRRVRAIDRRHDPPLGRPSLRRPDRRGLQRRAPSRAPTGTPRSRSRSSSSTGRPVRRRYLELADTLTSRRGYGLFADGRFDLDYYQDAEPVRDARSIVGHAVRALYLAAGVTDIYAETGDEALLDSMLRQWDDLTAAKIVPDRRRRLTSLRRGDRRSLRAASRPRVLRDLRVDRQHHVELADAARHR